MVELAITAAISTAISVGVSFIASALAGTQKLQDVVGPRLSELKVQTSTYGEFIRVVYGTTRLAGNVIWAQDIEEEEVRTTTRSSGGGKGGGGGGAQQTSVTYNYYIDMAIGLCEGPIDAILRIWADGVPLDLTLGTYRIHRGTEDQDPDPYIESIEGVGNTPAYRGLAYVVVERFPIGLYGNRIPNFTFEIRRTVKNTDTVEDKITEIVLIPGSGEFVYDTVIQSKIRGVEDANGDLQTSGAAEVTNSHNFDGGANIITALNDLLRDLPNIETIAVVVNWFASGVEADTCTIIPKVEYAADVSTTTPNQWAVAGLTRETATVINFFADGVPTYGGTPSDQSLVRMIRYINETLGLNVMLYPMPLVDIIDSNNPKPWRGRITTTESTGADTRISNFFNGTNRYNAFIMHYVNLNIAEGRLMDYVDSIVIGSEMVGLTQVHWPAASGTFPAVNQFKGLAATVKSALTSQGNSAVKTVYAADWSEYHSVDGWFNMDPLYTDSNLDIIGIDYYMPLTPVLSQSEIDKDTITASFESEEGWEYYYTDSFNKTGQTFYSPPDGSNPYAWKNIEAFWKASAHTNPDASNNWSAKAKPVWITEYGFPSVDACTNMPNVFYDPRSIESFFPIGSTGNIDFPAQRVALDAFVDYWDSINQELGNADLVPRKFLWTWDARPYPFWPYLEEVWADGILWEPGHWVQGKLGVSTLGAVIGDLLQRVGFTSGEYDVGELSDLVFGFSLSSKQSVRNHIETLQKAYQFDAVESGGVLKFKSRRNKSSVVTIEDDELVVQGQEYPVEINRQQQLELPTYIDVSYVDINRDYQIGTQISQRQTINSDNNISISFEIVFGDQFAKQIADINMYTAWVQRTSYKFKLPPKYCRVEPTDIITLDLEGTEHEVRVLETRMEFGGVQEILGIAHDVSTYNFNVPPQEDLTSTLTKKKNVSDTDVEFLDLPAFSTDTGQQGYLRIGVVGINGDEWKGAVLYRSDDGGEDEGNTFGLLTTTQATATIGTVLNFVGSGPRNAFDYGTTIDVLLKEGELESISELGMLNGGNVALVGNELIQFQTATLVSANRYTLSKLLRGRLGTEHEIDSHSVAERFVLINNALSKVEMPLDLIGLSRFYKAVSIGKTLAGTDEESFNYMGNTLKPYSVVALAAEYSSNDIIVSWTRRTRINGHWKDGVDIPLVEETEAYEIEILDGSAGNVLRTLTATTTQVTYTEAQQIEDFGSGAVPLSTLRVAVYQMSTIIGRGTVNDSTLQVIS
jgi:hypothetical protein